MRATISIFIGMFLILICYQIIKYELNGAIIKANSKYGHISDENTENILSNLDEIENTVNELNRSFYEMISELEGKFSIHDKEIELITEKIDTIGIQFENNLSKITSDISESQRNLNKISKKQRHTEEMVEKSTKDNQNTSSVNNIDIEKTFSSNTQIDLKNIKSSKIKAVQKSHLNDTDKKNHIESLNEIEKEKLRDTIVDLRHKGFSINQIAKKLNVGVGELQLVLKLHRK